jgi:acylphosphatase
MADENKKRPWSAWVKTKDGDVLVEVAFDKARVEAAAARVKEKHPAAVVEVIEMPEGLEVTGLPY